MSDDRRTDEQLAERLLAEDRAERAPAPGDRTDALLAALVEGELAAERRVRQAAVGAWRAVVALVPLVAVLAFMVRMVSDGWVRDAVRMTAVVVAVLGGLALFLAALTTVAWLFRSRSVSLAVIERRLAALEERLTRR